MHSLDIAIIGGFILYFIYSGLKSRKVASKNLEEYFLAGRTLKGWQAGLSMAATQFASDTPLLVTGLIATAGVFALWQMWIYALSFLFVGFLLAPCWRRAKVLTDAELTELRYGNSKALALRVYKAFFFGTVFNCTVLAWVFFAATRIAEPFLIWNEWISPSIFGIFEHWVRWVGVPLASAQVTAPSEVWTVSTNNFISVLAILVLTLFYSTTGGLRAVVRTDIAQLTLMLTATFLYAGFVINEVGGFSALHEKLRGLVSGSGVFPMTFDQLVAFTPDQAYNVSGAMLAVFALQWLIQINSDGTGYLAQRSMACKSSTDAKQAAVVFSFAQIFLRSLLWLPLGLGLLILYAPSGELLAGEREVTYVYGIKDVLPAGISGLIITGMIAALASTVDTHLNWGASYWTNDIYDRLICRKILGREPNKRNLVWVARISNLLILLISLVIATQLSSIKEAWQISLLLGAGVGVVLVLRWIWWRINGWSEILALVASAVFGPLAYYTLDSAMERLLFVALACTSCAVVVSYIFKPEDKDLLLKFYDKVKPPGFWGIAGEAHAERSRKKFFIYTGAALCCAFSIFCLLVGIGSLMVHSPAPTWFPYRGLWIGLCIGLGLALTPVWWWLGFKKEEEE